MTRTLTFLAATALLTGSAEARICFENQTDRELFIVIHSDGGPSIAKMQQPGMGLCAADVSVPATVSAYESEDDLEGCSRRIVEEGTVAITDYQSVDLCRWSE